MAGFAVCTGALVNNTAENGTPYFLTANHCLGNPNTWVYYFNPREQQLFGVDGTHQPKCFRRHPACEQWQQ